MSLPNDLLARTGNPSLEEIKEEAGKWYVVFSYLTATEPVKFGDAPVNDFARSLQVRRQFREFIVDGITEKVSMRNPANPPANA